MLVVTHVILERCEVGRCIVCSSRKTMREISSMIGVLVRHQKVDVDAKQDLSCFKW